VRRGRIIRVSGPLVVAELEGARMYEVVRVGEEGLIGEVIAVTGKKAAIQVYEETTGLRPGEPVSGTGEPLSVELGPGLIGRIYDGVQRPLPEIALKSGPFVTRGVSAPALDRKKRWHFAPRIKKGDKVVGGDILGVVQETPVVETKILVPPNVKGIVEDVVAEGDYCVEDIICVLRHNDQKIELKMYHRWPVRIPRPYKRKLPPVEPLITGQRIIDFLFPISKGGVAAIPGGFGTGKTVMQHQLAKWSDADIVVYVGCGERGNEMAEVLESFPELKDPRTGQPLMSRTVLIANTSNMPIAAREASVYTGVTIAEFFRDMGYNVALMADSTSRWAEAMREMSGRLEEMPGEEGFPAYLASRIAEFYERAGRVETLGSEARIGSLTIVGAVSPPGGDFSEPVTQCTLRVVKVFWALDTALAYRRHFPAINWLTSYSLYVDDLDPYFEKQVEETWGELRRETMRILQEEAELLEIIRIVGPEALTERQRLTLEVARMIREDFLMQHAKHPVDTYCAPFKTLGIISVIIEFYKRAQEALELGIPLKEILGLQVIGTIARLKSVPHDQFEKRLEEVREKLRNGFEGLKQVLIETTP